MRRVVRIRCRPQRPRGCSRLHVRTCACRRAGYRNPYFRGLSRSHADGAFSRQFDSPAGNDVDYADSARVLIRRCLPTVKICVRISAACIRSGIRGCTIICPKRMRAACTPLRVSVCEPSCTDAACRLMWRGLHEPKCRKNPKYKEVLADCRLRCPDLDSWCAAFRVAGNTHGA